MWYFLGRNGLLSITLDTNAGFYHLALRGTVTTFPQFRLPDALGVPWARDAQIPPVSWASNLLICIFRSAWFLLLLNFQYQPANDQREGVSCLLRAHM